MNYNKALQILGVDPSRAMTAEEVKRVYRRKSKETHPDLGGSDEQFRQVETAYRMLRSGYPGPSGAERLRQSAIYVEEDYGWEHFYEASRQKRYEEGRLKETDISHKVIKMLKSVGAEVLNVHGHAMQAAGWPDLYIASPHFRGWVELKVDSHPLTQGQKDRLRRLARVGDVGFVLRYSNKAKTVRTEDAENVEHARLSAEAWRLGDGAALLSLLRGAGGE